MLHLEPKRFKDSKDDFKVFKMLWCVPAERYNFTA